MFIRTVLASLALTISTPCSTLAEDAPDRFQVGQVQRVFHPDRPRYWRGAGLKALRTTIWLPVDATLQPRPHDIGPPGGAYFHGVPLVEGAPLSPAQRTYPLIVMSHGTGGTADTMDWIAAPLATAGYLVVAVDHPGNNAFEPLTWDGFTLWWERAADLSDVLDRVLADPLLGPRVDRDRIGALGFSLGGYTVLELAGATTNLGSFRAFCASPAADNACRPREMDRLADPSTASAPPSPERQASLSRSGTSYRDTRIRAMFAIAPAVGQAFDAASLAGVDVPISLLGGDADVDVPPDTNIRHLAALLPDATLRIVPGAGHYAFVPVCAPAMVDLAPQICTDDPGVDRAAIHREAVEQARSFFAQALTSSQ